MSSKNRQRGLESKIFSNSKNLHPRSTN
uniref:Uncharacterized protein n=1 Tax=Rhizophora mucronata TaxID=61149 RepID=A0A2P2R3Y3_RHIMU